MLKREDYWIQTLKTIYPYGLTERARKHDSEAPVGKLVFSITRTKQWSARCRNNIDYLKNNRLFYEHS